MSNIAAHIQVPPTNVRDGKEEGRQLVDVQ